MRFQAAMACACLAVAAPAAGLAGPPVVRSLRTAGGQRGTTVEVTAQGTFDAWPAAAWCDNPGVTVTPGADKGKLTVVIAPDAAPGACWIRLYDASGASEPAPFIVGTIAEVGEQETNDAHDQAQAVSEPCVVNGCLQRNGDVDHYVVPLEQGQTLVASLAAHETLGSPMDAVLHIVAPGGQQLAYNHDQRGLDPEIVFTAPARGAYVVRVFAFPSAPNSSIAFSGSIDYVYRLTLTTGGFVDYAWPLAATRDRETRVELVGWNVPESLSAVTIRPDPSSGERYSIADAQLANLAVVAVEPHETSLESEPNSPAAPQPIALPRTVSGRIDAAGDVDAFSFQADPATPLVFSLESRALGYPLDGVLEVVDAEGKSLAKVDDAGAARDPQLTFTPPSAGEFRALVRDLNNQGSPRHVYRLRAMPAVGDFQVTADKTSYTATDEQPAEIALAIERQHGFAEEIHFTVGGLPEGLAVAPAVSAPSGDTAKAVKLTVPAGAAFSGPIRIHAQAAGPSKLQRVATAPAGARGVRIAPLWLTIVAPPATAEQ